MDFKIQQTYPSPAHGISNFNSLIYAHNISSLVLYGQQKPVAGIVPEQPKKKIAFKANKSETNTTVDKISIFSIQSLKWQIKECKGKIPTPRSQFNIIYMGSCMILYGGRSGQKLYNDIHALNTETWVWKKLFTLENPVANIQNIFCKLDEKSACLIVSDILWILHTEDVKWQLGSNQLPGSVWQRTHIQLPSKPLFCLKISETDILVIGEQQSYRINIIDRLNVSAFNFDITKLLTNDSNNNKPCTFIFGNNLTLVNGSNIHMLTYRRTNENTQQLLLKQNTIKLNCDVHCIQLVNDNQKKIYAMDKKGELYSVEINCGEVEQEEQQPPQTTRIIESPIGQENNQAISQEDNEEEQSMLIIGDSSRVQDHTRTSNKNMTKNNNGEQLKETAHFLNNNIENNHHNRHNNTKNIQYKIKRPHKQSYQSNDQLSSQIHIEQGQDQSQLSDSNALKQKLSIILTHQHLKRRLLEQKANSLEEIIKKSEKFVLLLCKFGNKNAKKKHIEEVKGLKQKLEYSISKEGYYRKEMFGNQIPRNIGSAVEQTISNLTT